jgi:hypothetical protein
MRSWCWCVVALAACTKPNPEVCCLDAADCASIGVSDPERTCAEGLACVNNACVVPSCSTDGCSAEAPVCDIGLDVCTGCTVPTDCDQFDTKVCDIDSGACVGCLEDLDCAASAPVCDARACRGCRLDSECLSGACGDDGSCVLEQSVVYLAPTGSDSGTCSREMPCNTIKFGLSQTSVSRNHIVLNNGSYAGSIGQIGTPISSLTTSALSLVIHGGSSTLSVTTGDGQVVFPIEVPTTIRDLTISFAPFGSVFRVVASTTLERVSIRSEVGIIVRGALVARDVALESTGSSGGAGVVVQTGSLKFERGKITGGANGIVAAAGTVELSNLLVHGTTKAGIDLTPAETNVLVGGSIDFVTISDTGAASTAAAALTCFNPNFPVRSSILWTPGSSRPVSDACNFSSTIAGPIGVVGATNNDPKFVNAVFDDFHLAANSPALDVVDTGPALDFEGDPRPQGARFDLGADERR